MTSKPLPLYLISGWKGAGKSTFIQSWLTEATTRHLRFGVVIDDGRSNLKLLLDGCVAETSTQAKPLDGILVELDGVVEPIEVAEMFTFVGESGEPPITDYEIAAVVTVVNSSQVLYEISQAESLESLGLSPFVPPDYRHSADVVLEQIEFANILVLNRLEGIDISDRSRIRQLLEWLNPRADLLEQVDRSWTPEFAERLDRLLGNLMTDRNFDFFETEESAGWLQLIDGMHPKSRSSQQIEFDDRIESNRDWPELTSRVNGFVFRTRKPMHPDRLNLALDALAEMGVVRMKGWIWLASRNDTSGMICVSGPCCTLISAGPWTDGERVSSFEVYSSDRTNERRNSVVGDRRIEIAIIGFDLNELQVRRRLKTCILSEEEFALGPDAWRKFPDPLPPWIPGEEVDRTELQ